MEKQKTLEEYFDEHFERFTLMNRTDYKHYKKAAHSTYKVVDRG